MANVNIHLSIIVKCHIKAVSLNDAKPDQRSTPIKSQVLTEKKAMTQGLHLHGTKGTCSHLSLWQCMNQSCHSDDS